MPEEEGGKMKKQLLSRLNRLGILPETAALDDVLDLAIEDILERRLQSLVFHKDFAKSVYQARQLIAHGHIAVGGKKVTSPSYLVLRDEEPHIDYAPSSTLVNADHPLRQTLSMPEPKTTREEPVKEETHNE